MSLNSFAPELLMEVFAHLTDVPTKVRLERVSKRFRDCIRNQESWKYDTELRIDETIDEQGLNSFLSHAKIITNFSIVRCSKLEADILAPLWAFAGKLKIEIFAFNPSIDACADNNQVVACCLGMFSKSLTSVALNCCWTEACNMLPTFAKCLPLCTNLQHVTFGRFTKDILNSLLNMPLKSLSLDSFNATISGERLAGVCNTAKGHSLHEICVKNARFGKEHMRFDMREFCQSLEPSAAQAINTLKVTYVRGSFAEVLPTLPTLLPNLASVILEDMLTSATIEDAMQLAEAVGGFMHACLQREKNITLELTLRYDGEGEFGKWFWNAINLVDVARSGTKRTENMEQWKRTLENGNATVDICVK